MVKEKFMFDMFWEQLMGKEDTAIETIQEIG